ncbi:protein of unknown function [bacterium A37T11]|nr:protein of unknown function [bacterium A37T11]
MSKINSLAVIILMAAVCCTHQTTGPNTLSNQEIKEGWKLLFDGKSTQGWHIYNLGDTASCWQVADGTLWCNPHAKNALHGDLVTDSAYHDFELILEWKIAKGGNSGVLINVQEQPQYGTSFATGPEYQLLDNANAEERHRTNPTHYAGAIYDVLGTIQQSHPQPFGQWNQSRIQQQGGKLTFWLNGTKTAEVQLGTPTWDSLVGKSNLHNFSDFGKAKNGKIALQDHTDEVFFRNIKIKEL